MLLNDRRIRDLCVHRDGTLREDTLLSPFDSKQVTVVGPKPSMGNTIKAISSGLSSVGYDIRIDHTIKMFSPTPLVVPGGAVIDPKNFNEALMREFFVADHFDIPPHGYVLANSSEFFRMPATVAGICLTKSTYARCGLLCNTTPLEPGWEGYLTLELANLTDLPLRVYAGEGIAQVMFFEVEQPSVTYADRNGKYQGQARTPVTPRLK